MIGIGAIFEMVMDPMPRTPARTIPLGLASRIISGIVVGWFFCSFHGTNPILGSLLGIAGALEGAFLGLRVRVAAIRRLGALPAALPEDVVAIGLAILAVTR